MFTGLVEGTGTISRRRKAAADEILVIAPGFKWESPLKEGESVSVSGVCLTVTNALEDGAFEAYASEETLKKSNLGSATKVNLERALRLTDRLGGHLVSGHSDGLAVLTRRESAGKSLRLVFSFPRELSRYIAGKGSVALEGVSLTVNSLSQGRLSVNVIPETLRTTTLSLLAPGTSVNLETDILAKFVESLLSGKDRKNLTLEKLLEEGF